MLTKITYSEALGRFRKLQPILILPNNINPSGPMGGKPFVYSEALENCFFEFGKGVDIKIAREKFKKLLNHFRYYNCNEESGEEVVFYK